MFSLIVTIIAILLVSALALVVMYYGGSGFLSGNDRAQVARVLNEGSQLSGALELYKSDNGDFPVGTSAQIGEQLVTSNYLDGVPGSGWEFRNDKVVNTELTREMCLQANSKLGIADVPLCSDPAISNSTVCCETPA
ncbi:pilin [Nostoc sp. CHAB 5834]|nr:pilin [Nostoc sp. CHAB 5834]